MNKYLNAELSAKERALDLLEKMSLEEKMGQVNCLFPFGDNWKDIKGEIEHGIGQVSTLDVREIKSLEEVGEWQRNLQKKIMDNSEHNIPATFHMEGLCGAFIQESTSFPSGIARGSSWNPELEEKIGQVVSRQELACGITQVLAPVLDITRDSRMGRQCESYGEDPTLAAALGSAYTTGIQNQEVKGRRAESVAKHFVGSQNSQGGIHGANCEITSRQLDEVYGKPFQAAITEAKLRGIMPCYSAIDGEPASVSKKLLTDLLRNEMGFEGVCASDYSALSNVHTDQKMGESLAQIGLRGMEAGMDIEMQNRVCFNDELKEWFQTGKADIKILDQAVLRILEAKFRMGLFENPYALAGEELEKTVIHETDKELSLQAALESLVLLKNNGVLPIKKKVKKIAVIGCHAQNARAFFGGYTHLSMVEAVYAVANSIAGMEAGSVDGKSIKMVPGTLIQSDETEEFAEVLTRQKPECKSLLESLREKCGDIEIAYAYGYPIAGDDLSGIDEALEVAKSADVIITTLGGKNGSCSVASMGEGVDGTNINLPFCQDTFIERAAELGIPMVGVHFDGRPISSDMADKYLDAIIEAWNPAEMGAEAISQVLLGEYNPGGKLPVSVAYNAGQLPIYYNHPNGSSYHQGASIGFADYVDMPHTPRYYFGHGLSYSDYEYTNLRVSNKHLNPDESIEITVDVRNTGAFAGDEVVQLYVKDIQASMLRPEKELAGFRRLHLKAGEQKQVNFTMAASQLAFLDGDMKWKIEKGDVELQVGSSAKDIRFREVISIVEDSRISGRNRAFYTKVRIE